MKLFKIACTLSVFISSSILFAEYRVFQYYVKSKYELPYENKAYLVTSSLDPVSYVSYHGGDDAISAHLIKTWTCKGNTAGEDYCPSPFESMDEQPANGNL